MPLTCMEDRVLLQVGLDMWAHAKKFWGCKGGPMERSSVQLLLIYQVQLQSHF